MSMGAQLADQS